MGTVSVFSPREDFTGKVGKVGFVNGVADIDVDVHAAELAYFRRQGYEIGERDDDDDIISDEFKAADADDTLADEPEVEIPGMPKADATRGEFAEFAEGMGIETEGLSKAKIIDAIKAEAAK